MLETHLGNFLPLFCLPKLFYFCLVSFSKQVLNFTENRRNMGEIYSKCSGQAFLEIDNGRRRGSHSRGGLESKRSQSVPFLSLSLSFPLRWSPQFSLPLVKQQQVPLFFRIQISSPFSPSLITVAVLFPSPSAMGIYSLVHSRVMFHQEVILLF